MKFAPKVTRDEAITIFELEYGCTVTKIYKYTGGVNSPAEAAMAIADIMQRHEKEAEG